MNALSVFSKLLLTTTAMATINFLAASAQSGRRPGNADGASAIYCW